MSRYTSPTTLAPAEGQNGIHRREQPAHRPSWFVERSLGIGSRVLPGSQLMGKFDDGRWMDHKPPENRGAGMRSKVCQGVVYGIVDTLQAAHLEFKYYCSETSPHMLLKSPRMAFLTTTIPNQNACQSSHSCFSELGAGQNQNGSSFVPYNSKGGGKMTLGLLKRYDCSPMWIWS